MSNTYFRCKQFTVHQPKAAMKVCTDACLFGAWVAQSVVSGEWSVKKVLDIGTGTGLLTLMLAQQSDAFFTAVEIDADAAEDALQNFSLSPWKERLQLTQGDIRAFKPENTFDLIISNPPFFENSLQSSDSLRNLALHSEALRLEELMVIAAKHLSHNGRFAVLLPFHRREECLLTAGKQGFFLEKECKVKQSLQHDFFRVMFVFALEHTPSVSTEISIREGEYYSDTFRALLKEYYLAF